MMTDQDQKPEKPEYSMIMVLQRLFGLVEQNKLVYVLVLVLAILGSLVAMISPLLVQQIVNLIAASSPFSNIITIIVYLAILAAVEAIISIANSYAITWLGIRAMYNVRNKMFQHLQKLSFTYFHTTKIGKIISYIANDVETVNSLISTGLITVIVQLFQLFGSIFFMFALSVQMSILPVLVMPVNIAFLIFFSRRSRAYYTVIRKTVSTVTGQAQETVDGFRTIKSFKSEDVVLSKFEKSARAELDANLKAAPLWGAMPAVFNTITFISIGSVVFLGGYLYFNGILPLDNIGLIFAFIMYVMLFLGPIGALSQFLSDVQNAVVGASRVLKLLAVKPDMLDPEKPRSTDAIVGEISFNHVRFGYDGTEVLHDIVLDIKPRERVAIVGPTGAGKTTIVSLIPRFYDVKAGSITIDGIDVREFPMRSLRKKVGLVLQDNFLFATSIMENIRYGKLDASDDDVMEAARKCGAHEFIMDLPKGYQTQVGERGVVLSIGQRQLIAFARTLLIDPPILILDEATSAVDAYSEILIQRSLEKLLANRTSIIIAHRMSTVVNSDTIIVLQDGQIMQKGNHQQLMMQEDGLYKVLYDLQFAESKVTKAER
ncbi:MAG TPA: ABC transporter ATP-binding protein [Candidatus Lokiarchaeia archaeon]|nr:ABC transporter ATP-binding protein [Candidatus Lokiarchaeia archaeon]